MKAKSVLIYPVFIVLLFSAFFFMAFKLMNSIGHRVNPPQETSRVEADLKPVVVWRDESTKDWLVSIEGPFDIFNVGETASENVKKLDNLDKGVFDQVALFVVKEVLIKKEAKVFLEHLSRFDLKKVYIASSFDGTMEALRGLEPRFWYAASPRSWVKWSLYSSFRIETLFSLDADFVFIDPKIESLLSPRLASEIKRRNLPMIFVDSNQKLKFN